MYINTDMFVDPLVEEYSIECVDDDISRYNPHDIVAMPSLEFSVDSHFSH